MIVRARRQRRQTSVRASTAPPSRSTSGTSSRSIDGDGVAVEGEGAGELPEDWSNLAVQAFALLATPPRASASASRNRIPLERGLGSCAAAIALGLAAAARRRARAERLLQLGGLARGARRQPRRRARRRRLPDLGRADRAGRGDAAGRRRSRSCRTGRSRRGRLAGSAAGARSRTRTPRSPPSAPRCSAPASPPAGSTLLAAALDDRLHEPYRAAAAPLLGRVRAELPAGAIGVDALRLRPDGDRLGAPRAGRRLRDRARAPLPGRSECCSSRIAPRGGAVSVRFVDCRYDRPTRSGAARPTSRRTSRAPPTSTSSATSTGRRRGRRASPAAVRRGVRRVGLRGAGSARARSSSPTTRACGGAARLWWLLRHFGHDGAARRSAVRGLARPARGRGGAARARRLRPAPARRRHDRGRGAPRAPRRPAPRALRRARAGALPRRARSRSTPSPAASPAPATPSTREPLPAEALEAEELVVYCGSGVIRLRRRCTQLVRAGRDDARLYPGSWSEWSRRRPPRRERR